ncbi:MAG: hypothetical protein U0792_00645 [Gemmataceae bacterium]
MLEADDAADGDFDYAVVSDADREFLITAAAQLAVSLRHGAAAVLEAGKLLAQAKRRLGRQHWRPWLAAVGVPSRSAARLLAVHRAFGAIEPALLERLTPTALYTLASPGTPQSLREYAVEQAKDGHNVTAGDVNAWLTLHRADPDLTPGQIRKLASKTKDPKDTVDADSVNAHENFAACLRLIGTANTLNISATSDVENGDTVVTGVLLADGQRRQATAGTVERVVMQLAGVERSKRCRGKCGEIKRLDLFSKRIDSADGRNHYCLECERVRVRNYERAKAEARAASAAKPTAPEPEQKPA